eukprot:gene14992-16538_t
MDKKLLGGLLASLNVPSLMFCANKCTSSQNCQTFNFKPQDLSATASEQINCQLLSMTKESSGATLTVSTGWIHYEPAVQESPRCRSVQCPAGFKCVESCTKRSGYECVEANRNVNAPTPVSPYCDKDMILGTYRISGSAGVKIPTYCVNSTSCSTTGAGWIAPPEPTQADGVVTRSGEASVNQIFKMY